MNDKFFKQARSLVVAIFLLATAITGQADQAEKVHGTLVVAVPVSDGLVVCSDKRLFNSKARTHTDDNVKIRRIGDNALFVATNTIGFYDQRTRSMAFDAFAVVEGYTANNEFNAGKPFWDGLKREITAKLRAYFAQRSFAEWPESDHANNDLLFNLIFYELRDGKAWSHSLKVFYEKRRTPVIYIPNPIREQVRTPKLSGKGREVMKYLVRNPAAAADPVFQRFDETRFDSAGTTAGEAVDFAAKLFSMTSANVPKANVSPTFDCSALAFPGGFRWIRGGGTERAINSI